MSEMELLKIIDRDLNIIISQLMFLILIGVCCVVAFYNKRNK